MNNSVLKRIMALSIVMLLLLSINTLVIHSSNAQRLIQLDSKITEINDRAIQWSVTLSFSETSGQVDNAIFCEAPDGNDSAPVDPYDMPKPPAPIQPYLRAWFNDNLPIPYNLLHRDCRKYPDTTKTWDLYVQWAPDDYVTPTVVTISWNSDDVNLSEYTSIILYDYDTSIPLLEMKNHSSYVYSSPALVPHHFQLQATLSGNNPPYSPSNPTPAHQSTNVSINTDLTWTGGDPDPGDTVTYDVYFGTNTNPSKAASNISNELYDPGTLNHNTKYYWKIIAWDNHGASTAGSLWDFTTVAQNNPPYEPSNPSPANNSLDVDIDIDLSWTGGDPDPGDTVTYDIYFGTSTPPPLVVNNQSSTAYDPGILDFQTTYYWKVRSWDNNGATTTGPIWLFTTRINNPPNKPSNPDPSNHATDVAINADLSWTGGDPDGDSVTYDVYFGTNSNPPKVADDLSSPSYDPGQMNYETTYYWYIISEDEFGETNTGDTWDFTTIEATNQPPEKPTRPSGKINGEAGTEYTYTTSTTDPEGSQLWYLFEWGDGTDSGWVGPFDSGATASASHSWEEGSYSIRVKAKDEEGLESVWSDRLSIQMPLLKINKQYYINLKLKYYWTNIMSLIVNKILESRYNLPLISSINLSCLTEYRGIVSSILADLIQVITKTKIIYY